MAKVINLFGGPGCGKSTIAYGLFYEMKINNYNVELVQEYAKELVYDKRLDILDSDQLFVLANQNRNLLIKVFQEKLDYVIMESPVLLSNIYFNNFSIYSEKLFKDLTLDLFKKFDNINFFLNRQKNINFDDTGRKHSEFESKMLDIEILKYLKNHSIEFQQIDINDETITSIISYL